LGVFIALAILHFVNDNVRPQPYIIIIIIIIIIYQVMGRLTRASEFRGVADDSFVRRDKFIYGSNGIAEHRITFTARPRPTHKPPASGESYACLLHNSEFTSSARDVDKAKGSGGASCGLRGSSSPKSGQSPPPIT